MEESLGAGGAFGGSRFGGRVWPPHSDGLDGADFPQGVHLIDCGAQVAVLRAEVPRVQGVEVQLLGVEVLQCLLQLVVDVPVGVGVRRGASDLPDLAADQESLIRILPQQAPQHSFGPPGSVGVRCVEEVGAELHGAAQAVEEGTIVLAAGGAPRQSDGAEVDAQGVS